MNKKSNFTRTVLLGALLCGIAGPSFVGCKDYDDDIDNLQVQIDQNKDAIAKLQELVNGGAIVTSVESDGNGGVIITLSDGSTHNITKGEKGDDGQQGPDGVAGKTPIFQISNGFGSSRQSQSKRLGRFSQSPRGFNSRQQCPGIRNLFHKVEIIESYRLLF